MIAADIMTRTVYAVHEDEPLKKAIELICMYGIAGVPVVSDKDRLAGIISEKDILRKMYPSYGEFIENPGLNMDFVEMESRFEDVSRIPSRDVMTAKVVTATPGTPVLKLASLMILKHIRRIPIVEDGKIVGMVSQGDVHKAIFRCHLP